MLRRIGDSWSMVVVEMLCRIGASSSIVAFEMLYRIGDSSSMWWSRCVELVTHRLCGGGDVV